jgi:hypothetical protein
VINDQETSARPSRDWRALLIQKIQQSDTISDDWWAMIYGMVSGMVQPEGQGAPAPSVNAPDSFASDGWEVTDAGTGGTIYLNVITLPADNGFTVSDIEYKRDAGLWTSIGAATTGLYEITGLTDGVQYTFRLRAQNEEGVGQQSSTKTATPSTGVAAVISGESFVDASDEVRFTVDQTGDWYWAVTETTDNPTGPEIVAGTGGGILEAGSEPFVGSTSFEAEYTNAVGSHGDTRRLHYLVDPSATGIFDSNIIRQNFTVELAPAAFAVGNWYLTNAATDGELTVTITALPDDNGYAISAIQYRVDGGAWTSFVGATVGNYTISSLVNDAEVDIELRAVNAEGNGDASDIKSETPTLAPEWNLDIVARWEADEGVVADGTEFTSWTDSVGGLSFSTITTGSGGTTPQYQVNGSPYLKPLIYLPTGTAITVPSLAGSAFPSGDAARSFMIIAAIPTGASSGQGVMYGTNASSQAFGITINSSELPVADHWAGGTTGTTSVADAVYRSFTATYASGTERLYVNGVEEGTASTGLTLNTPLNILRAGRDLANTAENPFGLLAIVVWDVALTAQQVADAHAALAATHLAA